MLGIVVEVVDDVWKVAGNEEVAQMKQNEKRVEHAGFQEEPGDHWQLFPA